MERYIYEIGRKEKVSKTISESDVYLFAGISGDFNPVHVNRIEAERSIFGKPIAHGILVAGLISNVIGMRLPGPGTIYIEQDLKFKKPVYIGDTVTACVEITEILNAQKNILKLNTFVVGKNDEYAVEGYAVVKAPERRNCLI